MGGIICCDNVEVLALQLLSVQACFHIPFLSPDRHKGQSNNGHNAKEQSDGETPRLKNKPDVVCSRGDHQSAECVVCGKNWNFHSVKYRLPTHIMGLAHNEYGRTRSSGLNRIAVYISIE